jgi:hypothetical protein
VAGSAVAGLFPTPQPGEADLHALITQSLTSAAVQLVLNIASLALADVVISGMHIRGVMGLLLAALALTAINLAFVYLPLIQATMLA